MKQGWWLYRWECCLNGEQLGRNLCSGTEHCGLWSYQVPGWVVWTFCGTSYVTGPELSEPSLSFSLSLSVILSLSLSFSLSLSPPLPLSLFLSLYLSISHHLVGVAVRSLPREQQPEVSACFPSGALFGSSYQWPEIGAPVATLTGAWCCRVRTLTGLPGVSIMWLGEISISISSL